MFHAKIKEGCDQSTKGSYAKRIDDREKQGAIKVLIERNQCLFLTSVSLSAFGTAFTYHSYDHTITKIVLGRIGIASWPLAQIKVKNYGGIDYRGPIAP